jgi:hypothetical protein
MLPNSYVFICGAAGLGMARLGEARQGKEWGAITMAERAITHIKTAAFTTLSVLAMALARQIEDGDESKRNLLKIILRAMEERMTPQLHESKEACEAHQPLS